MIRFGHSRIHYLAVISRKFTDLYQLFAGNDYAEWINKTLKNHSFSPRELIAANSISGNQILSRATNHRWNISDVLTEWIEVGSNGNLVAGVHPTRQSTASNHLHRPHIIDWSCEHEILRKIFCDGINEWVIDFTAIFERRVSSQHWRCENCFHFIAGNYQKHDQFRLRQHCSKALDIFSLSFSRAYAGVEVFVLTQLQVLKFSWLPWKYIFDSLSPRVGRLNSSWWVAVWMNDPQSKCGHTDTLSIYPRGDGRWGASPRR